MMCQVIELIMILSILECNARSLVTNGQKFKKVIKDLDDKRDVIHIQETWLRSHLEFVLAGCNS